MARKDIYLDAMLRHLGAAYYESLHGRATRADVTRAVDTVEEHLNEHTAHPAAARPSPHPAHHDHRPRHHRWACRVRDVMTTSVVTVDRITPYKEIDRLLAEHKISGVPVLTMGRHVAGLYRSPISSRRRTRPPGRSGSAPRPTTVGGSASHSTRP